MQDSGYEYYRYPGSRPFHNTYMGRRLFFGRSQQKQSLLHAVLVNNLVVLHGPAGVGKTSLVNAGISHELRQRNYIPISIRFSQPGIDPLAVIYNRIIESASQQDLYCEPGEEDTLWQYFKTLALRSPDNTLLHPVLILDQFEDFFLFTAKENKQLFIRQLADVVNNTIPKSLQESIKPGAPLLYNLMPPPVKIIMVVQEDFLEQLEGFSRDYPGLFNNRFKLEGLTREQAKQAIIEPTLLQEETIGASPFQFSPDAVDMMLNFLSKPKEVAGFTVIDEVEPFPLQLLCRDLEEKVHQRLKEGEKDIILQPQDLGGEKGMNKALKNFYDNQVKRVGSIGERRNARRLCEKKMLQGSRRLTLEKNRIEDQFTDPVNLLEGLVRSGLVQTQYHGEETCYELSHDKLVPLVRESAFRNRIKHITAAVVIIICIFLLVGIFSIIPGSRGPSKRAALANYINRGNFFLRRNNYEQARDSFLRGIAIYPNYAPSYNGLGMVLLKQGKYQEAMEAYRKAVELNPRFTSARANLAESALLLQRFDIAFNHAQELVKQKSIHPDINSAMRLISIAVLLYQGKDKEALNHLKAFITYYKGLPDRYTRIWNYQDLKEFQTIDKKLPPGQIQVLLQLLDILRDSKPKNNKKIEKLEMLIQQEFQ